MADGKGIAPISGSPSGAVGPIPVDSSSSGVGTSSSAPSSMAANLQANPLVALASNTPTSDSSSTVRSRKPLSVGYSSKTQPSRLRQFPVRKRVYGRGKNFNLNRGSNPNPLSLSQSSSAPSGIALNKVRKFGVRNMSRGPLRSTHTASADITDSVGQRYDYEYGLHADRASSRAAADPVEALNQIVASLGPEHAKEAGQVVAIKEGFSELQGHAEAVQESIRAGNAEGIKGSITAAREQLTQHRKKVQIAQEGLKKCGVKDERLFDSLNKALDEWAVQLSNTEKEAELIAKKTEAERAEHAKKLGIFATDIASAFASLLNAIGSAIRNAAH